MRRRSTPHHQSHLAVFALLTMVLTLVIVAKLIASPFPSAVNTVAFNSYSHAPTAVLGVKIGGTAAFARVGEISGPSTAPNHENEFELTSYAWHGSRVVPGGSMLITMLPSSSSPMLLQAVIDGRTVPSVIITTSESTGENVRWVLGDVTLTRYAVESAGGQTRESVTLVAARATEEPIFPPLPTEETAAPQN